MLEISKSNLGGHYNGWRLRIKIYPNILKSKYFLISSFNPYNSQLKKKVGGTTSTLQMRKVRFKSLSNICFKIIANINYQVRIWIQISWWLSKSIIFPLHCVVSIWTEKSEITVTLFESRFLLQTWVRNLWIVSTDDNLKQYKLKRLMEEPIITWSSHTFTTMKSTEIFSLYPRPQIRTIANTLRGSTNYYQHSFTNTPYEWGCFCLEFLQGQSV